MFLVTILGLLYFASTADTSPSIVLLSQSPVVGSDSTTLTCADLSSTLPVASLSIRRQFTWGGSMTTESTHTRISLNQSAVVDKWTSTNVNKAIGAFGCGAGDNAVTAVKMHSNGSLVPETFSKIAVVGRKVVIRMNLAGARSSRLREVTWYKNGRVLDTKGTSRIWDAEGGRALAISPVVQEDAGIYMAHHGNEDKIYAVGTVLIVRRCQANRWSSSCVRVCPTCNNGGACNEKTGKCICSPGFSGKKCETACQNSTFGPNCGTKCSTINSGGSSSCRGIQLCSIAGCQCMNGWTGLDCTKQCPTGFYGSGCDLECSCQNGGTCDRFQGCVCKGDWTGKNCEVSSTESEPTPDSGTTNDNGDRMPPPLPRERKPNITDVVANPSFKVNVGQRVHIQCSVTGVPAPQHGEIKLHVGNGREVAPTETKMSEYVTTSSFTLTMTLYAGPFYCVARTSAGQTRKEFNFTIPVLPTPRNPPELVDLGPKFLLLRLNSFPFEGDGPIVNTKLLFKRSDEDSYRTYASRSILNDTARITDLDPFTNYTFRVLLFREGGHTGIGHPGPTAVIRTFCDYPSSGPTIKNIHAKNDTILYLSWRLPPQDEIKGEVMGYKIYYKVLGEAKTWTKVTFAYSSTTSATLKNMKPLAVYSVKIRLYNCAGDSPDSKEVRVTMGRLETPAGPEARLDERTSRTMRASWLPPSNAKPYTISGYEVSLVESDVGSPNGLRILQNVSEVQFNGTALTPYTEYTFKVRAYNHEGPGNFSDEISFRTKEEAPGMPSNFRVDFKTPSEIHLAWDVPEHPNGVIRQYVVNYTRQGDFWTRLTVSGTNKELRIKGLNEYTSYKFRVQAVTIEPGEWSDLMVSKTMSSKPLEPPRSISVTPTSPESVSIRWDPPVASEYVHDIKKYRIVFTDDMRQNIEHWNAKLVDGKVRSLEVDQLRSDTVYLFAIAAVTENTGPYSEEKTSRTLRLGIPPPPREVEISNITSHSAHVKWEIANGYSITHVEVRVKSAGTLDWENLYFPAGTGSWTLNNLDSSTKYNVELSARNRHGESSGNPIRNFGTLAGSIGQKDFIYRILIPVGVVILLVIAGTIIYCRCRRRSGSDTSLEMLPRGRLHRASTIGSSFNAGAIHSRSGTLLSSHSIHSANSRAPSTHSGQLLVPENLILAWESIFFEDITLGEGNFGQVVKAVIQIDDQCVQAAVKLLKDGCSADDRKDFLAELDMMVRIEKHPNIISLIGACEHGSCLYLCTEYAPNGNLLQFLRKSRLTGVEGAYTSLTQEQLLQFALDICQGMSYLSEKELIHRDLAARNVLLSGNLTCKVADFGLSRGEGVYVKKTVARLPIRWMAIESLNYNVYTTKSDVWSFGVLLWEIVSLGGTPYYGMSCAELYEKLPTGYRMDQPINCDGEVYKLMCQCWKDRPYDRPSFSQLCVALRRMIDARSNINYVNTSIFENFSFFKIDANEEEEG